MSRACHKVSKNVFNKTNQHFSNASNRRAGGITIENAITAFLSKVKIGPEFVCTSCHCVMSLLTVLNIKKLVLMYYFLRILSMFVLMVNNGM